MHRRPLFAFLSAAIVSTAAAPASAENVKIPFTKTQLENGMTVILHEDKKLPLVVVNVSYNVGSRFEAPHRTGFAHLFEHLMFMGTRRAPTKMFDQWMEAGGGYNNAWTSEDRTDYYDVGPTGMVDLLLWLEADRLRDLGPLMTLEKLNAQRDVVRNERRQTSENTPYGKVELRLPELLYPESHPYHHPVIGSHEDLERASVPDVKNFFDQYYDPGNASIVVAGDIEPAAVLEKIKRDFGSIPSRHRFRDPGAPGFSDSKTTLGSVARETIEDNVELPKVVMAWQSPKHFGPGDAELDILSNVLAGGKTSRLYKSLVYDKKIAQSVEAQQQSGTVGSRFVVGVIVKPGVPLDKIEAAIDAELDALRKKNITDEELTKTKNGIQTSFVSRLESVQERASLLNAYQAEVKDPGFIEQDLARYESATADKVKEAAAAYLLPNARVILHVVPKSTGAAK
jgi:predicted Zn-dependent peptidase